MKQGLLDLEKEHPRRVFSRSSNATTSGDTIARSSEVGMVTIAASKTTIPFTGASGSSSQKTKYPPRVKRVFTPLYMPLSKALEALLRKGYLKLLEQRPLPDPVHHGADKSNCQCHDRFVDGRRST